MSMIDALRFLTRCRLEPDLRDEIWDLPSPTSFFEWVSAEGFHFTNDDVQHALDNLRIHAADEYEAEDLDELGAWYQVVAMDEDEEVLSEARTLCEGFDPAEEVGSLQEKNR